MSGARWGGRHRAGRWALTALVAFAAACACPGFDAARAAGPPIGVRLGAAGARLHGSTGDDVAPDYRAGFTLGISTRLPIRPSISFQPELQWITKGGQGDFTIGIVPAHAEFSLQYVEAPLLMRFDVPVEGPLAPFIVAGPAVAWRVAGDVDLEVDELVATPAGARREAAIFETVGSFDDPDFSDWDFGVLGGAGVVLGRGRARLTLEARYTRGFVNLYDFSDAEATNGGFATTLGVELR